MNERIKSAKASFGKMIFSKKECKPVNMEEGWIKQTDKSNKNSRKTLRKVKSLEDIRKKFKSLILKR